MQIGEKIKMLMDEKGWTIYRLAKVTGCSQSTVARWVNGEGIPQKQTIVRIAKVFGVSSEFLRDDDLEISSIQSHEGVDYDDIIEIRQALRERPEMKMLFDAGMKATPQTVRQTAQFLEGLANGENSD